MITLSGGDGSWLPVTWLRSSSTAHDALGREELNHLLSISSSAVLSAFTPKASAVSSASFLTSEGTPSCTLSFSDAFTMALLTSSVGPFLDDSDLKLCAGT
nr:hypothetical protein Iba_chr02eCG1160 [Ipomoea batatas]